MKVKERILRVKLLNRIENNKEYAFSIGVKNVSFFKGIPVEKYVKKKTN